MAEIVNLNKARKQRARVEAAARAAENRVKHGRTGGERARDAADAARLSRAHAGAELEPSTLESRDATHSRPSLIDPPDRAD